MSGAPEGRIIVTGCERAQPTGDCPFFYRSHCMHPDMPGPRPVMTDEVEQRGYPTWCELKGKTLAVYGPQSQHLRGNDTPADHIVRAVGAAFTMDIELLLAPSKSARARTRMVAFVRHIAMYLIREHTRMSSPEIGRFFGGRDHTTVIAAVTKVELLLAAPGDDGQLTRERVAAIREALSIVARGPEVLPALTPVPPAAPPDGGPPMPMPPTRLVAPGLRTVTNDSAVVGACKHDGYGMCPACAACARAAT